MRHPTVTPGARRATMNHSYTMTPGASRRAAPPAPWPPGDDPAQWVTARLEEAGRTLISLPHSGYTTALRISRLDTLNPGGEPEHEARTRLRPAMPSSAAVSRMDEAFAWFRLIPDDRYVLRRILGGRALVHPITGRHVNSWRKLGALIGADHNAVRRWHGEAVALLVRGLR